MASNLKLVNLIYLPLALASHWLIQKYFVDIFGLPANIIIFVDLLLVFSFAMRLSKRHIPRFSYLKKIIKLSLLCFSFFSFYLPTLALLTLIDITLPITAGFAFTAFLICIILTVIQAKSVFDFRIIYLKIPAPIDLPKLKGLSFLHLSDLHLGPYLDERFLKSLIKKMGYLNFHFICVTGDLIDGPFAAYHTCLDPIVEMAKKCPVYYVTGNHEYYYDADLWIQKLKNLGVKVLRSEIEMFTSSDFKIYVAGVDDPLFSNNEDENFREKLRKLHNPCLLLSHRPET